MNDIFIILLNMIKLRNGMDDIFDKKI